MRKIALLAVVAFAAACGSSSDPAPPNSGITGTVNGAAFNSAANLGLVFSGNSCTLGSLAGDIPIGVSMAVVNVTNVASTCTQFLGCQLHSNSKSLALVLARVRIGAAGTTVPAPGLAAGTYPFFDLANPGVPPTPDANGNISLSTGFVVALGATPTCTPTQYAVQSGSVTVTSVSGNTITGTVSVTLANGAGSLSGNFTTTPDCTPTPAPSACDILNGFVASGSIGTCPGTPTCN